MGTATFMVSGGLALALIALSPDRSWAQSGSGSSHLTICKLKKEVRTIRVEKASPVKCLTWYGKMGKEEVKGEGQYEASCVDVLGRIRKNLEEGGWVCRQAKTSAISDLNDEVR